MFDNGLDQAAGLRRLILPARPRLVPVGRLVSPVDAARFMNAYAASLSLGQGQDVFDRAGLLQLLASGEELMARRGRRVFWMDEPVATARWVQAQAGDRLMLLLSHRRELMMAQYAEIKKVAAATGIRRFGVLFTDVEQAEQGRQRFLALAGCARRFLGVHLDVVLGSREDDAGLTLWSGLSMAELSGFEWDVWSEAGMPLTDTVVQEKTH